ncbi:uncharacterized protein [Diadema antillarum]|uniref:uncharacterized protein n=1 Tax=Diadema antillarum TaxID=105358 RepID=UPI003A842AC5
MLDAGEPRILPLPRMQKRHYPQHDIAVCNQAKQQAVGGGDPFSGHAQGSSCIEGSSVNTPTGVTGLGSTDDDSASCAEFRCHVVGCEQSFSSTRDYEEHYGVCHRFVCRYCRRFYPTDRLLGIHLEESHDSLFSLLAAKQPMYRCLEESCGQSFMEAGQRREHLVHCHGYHANFQFDRRQGKRSVDQTGGCEESREVAMMTERRKLMDHRGNQRWADVSLV